MASILEQLRAEGDAAVGSGLDAETGPRSSINAFDLLLRAVKGAPGQMLEDVKALPGKAKAALDTITSPRVALPLVAGPAGPLVSGLIGAGSEAISQIGEIRSGERTDYDPLHIGVAGAIPPGVATAVRGVRGLGRTLTRFFPSKFEAAQRAALGATEDVATQLTPEGNAAELFRAARRGPIVAPALVVPTREGVERTLEAATATRPTVSGRAATLQAAEDLATGRPLDLGEVGRRRAATRAGDTTTPLRTPAATITPPAPGTISADRLTTILDDLDATISKTPTDPGLQQVRQAMENLRGVVKDGAIDFEELLRQRLDLSRLSARRGAAPELRALYGHGGENAKGIIGALEEAADAGNAGAKAVRQALDIFKRDLGIAKWKDLVEEATRRTNMGGVETPTLNIARLSNLVDKNADELTRLLGGDGMTVVRGFITRFATLPPTHAATAANMLVSAGLGTFGAVAGAGAAPGLAVFGAVAGLGAKELIQNAWAVGKNPALVSQVMTGLAQATRAAVTAPQPFNGPRVRQGVPPRG